MLGTMALHWYVIFCSCLQPLSWTDSEEHLEPRLYIDVLLPFGDRCCIRYICHGDKSGIFQPPWDQIIWDGGHWRELVEEGCIHRLISLVSLPRCLYGLHLIFQRTKKTLCLAFNDTLPKILSIGESADRWYVTGPLLCCLAIMSWSPSSNI